MSSYLCQAYRKPSRTGSVQEKVLKTESLTAIAGRGVLKRRITPYGPLGYLRTLSCDVQLVPLWVALSSTRRLQSTSTQTPLMHIICLNPQLNGLGTRRPR